MEREYRVQTLRILATTAQQWGRGRRDELALRRMHGAADSVGQTDEGAAKRPHRCDGKIPRTRMGGGGVGAGARTVKTRIAA